MLTAAFADPVHASQHTFRAVMDALARPGTIITLAATVTAPSPLHPAAAAVALTLLDYETPVWLDHTLSATRDIADWIRFHTGAPVTSDPRAAAFAFVADGARAPDLDVFSLGTSEYPDRSTTLVLQVKQFSAGESLILVGPGIAGTQRFAAGPLPNNFREQLTANRALFPRGVDVILATDDAIAALPRSVRVVTDRGEQCT
jgi:alpha-D-ribose 1-methylphosphonate 5-triphosphate synthase subunit PhnH